MQRTARVIADKPGIDMEVLTDQPGILYSGNFRTAFCLETQHFPDSPNHPDFPSTILEPGTIFTSKLFIGFPWKN